MMENVTSAPQGRQGRAMVIARNGLVASGHPLAAAAGLRVLQDGGNAIDAAVTIAGVLGVVQPMWSGLGGDAFVLVWPAAERKLYAINGSGAAPSAATRGWFTSRGYTKIPLRGMLSVAIPGAVDAMVTLLQRWGSRRFSLADLLTPAIEYAEEGFPVAPKVASWIAATAEVITRYPTTASIFLPQGRPVRAGEMLVMKDLGASLRVVADRGRDAFYEGELAGRLVGYSRDHGGLLTARDLSEHRTEVTEPIHTTYRGLMVYTTPPPSQGLMLLELLNIIEGIAPERLRWGTPEAVHLMVEANKLVVADRLQYVGDPRFVDAPVRLLLSKEYAARRRQAIDPSRASAAVQAGGLPEAVGDTTYFCIGDGEGTIVSYISSLSAKFGCGEVVQGTGILLNNRAGRGFVLEEGHPNCIAPGKRTMHTLMPFLALRDGAPYLAWGTPGGDGQPQWNAQIFINIIDNQMNIQRAVEVPRWLSFPATDPENLPAPYELRLEPGFPDGLEGTLAALGHTVREMEYGGTDQPPGAQVILVDDGIYYGASDPRVDGCAVGY